MTLKIVIMVIAGVLSACFAAAELAFSTFSKTKIRALADKEKRCAALALKLADKEDSLLTTLLIGKAILTVMIASLGMTVFIEALLFSSALDFSIAISTAVISLSLLIVCEAVPKAVTKKNPDRSVVVLAPVMIFFYYLLIPLTFLYGQLTRLLTRVFNTEEDDKSEPEEELISIIEEAEEEGEFDKEEGTLIKSAIEFAELEVNDIFTPRIDITAISKDATNEEIDEVYTNSGFSRLPVYEEDLDNIIGILYYKDFYTTDFTSIEEILKPVIYVAKTQKINDLMKELQEKQLHMAVVMDEFGSTAGIVTLEDVLEEIVGEIWDEHDEKVEEFQKVGDNEYVVSGKANLSKLFDELEIEEEMESQTVNGWTMTELGKIPEVGDEFESIGLKVKVLNMDGKRIENLQVIDMRERESDADSENEKQETEEVQD